MVGLLHGRRRHDSVGFLGFEALAWDDPQTCTWLLDVSARDPLFLAARAAAGAQALMVFDTWGGLLPPDACSANSAAPWRKLRKC